MEENPGASDKEAFWHVMGEQALSLGLDFLSGAISGGAMGGGAIGNNNITKLDAARNGKTFEEYLNSSVKNDTINESEANTDEGVEISIKITIRKSAQKNMFWVHAFEPIKKPVAILLTLIVVLKQAIKPLT